jgi:multiple sugar transport system ATP-binding protein
MNLVEDGATWVGFRPEAFLPSGVAEAADAVSFPFRVTRVEYLGAERLVYGKLEGGRGAHIISRLPTNISTEIGAGETREFRVRARDLTRFDRASGRRIDGGAS